ncbi:MAG: dienelactone hydrolase family protein [Dongiaceae bacterium]
MQKITDSGTALAGVSLEAILADPLLAAMAAGQLETVTIKSASGRTAKGALALPKSPGPAILLLHEWWGLNDEVKAVAHELAEAGYVALALDLYDGKVAKDADTAGKYMGALDRAVAMDLMGAAIDWLRQHPKSTGKVGTLGWCMGGGLSIDASIARPVDATIAYYGRVDHPIEELKKLKGPVLGHFAERDQWIDHAMVDPFEAAMKKAGRPLDLHWYEADHAFSNPTGANFQKPESERAWQRTLDFFRKHLGR